MITILSHLFRSNLMLVFRQMN